MVASETKPKQGASPKGSRSPIPPVPAQNKSPSTNDKDRPTIGTPQALSIGMQLRDHLLQLGANPSLTRLSPALDLVHVTTTEQSPVISSETDITIQLRTELVATANELYRKDIDGHIPGEARGGKAPDRVLTTSSPPFPDIFARTNTQKLTDEDYWSSFPPHIKQFVRSIAS